MKVFLVAALAILICASTYGQARKCTGPDGKVTYSDVMCDNKTVGERRVNTNANTIDHSGLRKEIAKAETAKEVAAIPASQPQDCTFQYYKLGDEKGQRLAAAAKAECLANNQAKLTGGPTTLEAYGFWRDHRATKVTERQAAITRAEVSAQAAATRAEASAEAAATRRVANDQSAANRNDFNSKPGMTCSPGLLKGTLDCR